MSSLAPSTRAASMISVGNILKFCRMKKMMNTDITEGRMIAACVLSSLRKENSLNIGMTMAIWGMMRVRSRIPKTRVAGLRAVLLEAEGGEAVDHDARRGP